MRVKNNNIRVSCVLTHPQKCILYGIFKMSRHKNEVLQHLKCIHNEKYSLYTHYTHTYSLDKIFILFCLN